MVAITADHAELNLNRDIVQLIIDAAHEFTTQADVTFPEEPEVFDEQWAAQSTGPLSRDPYYTELINKIEDLEPDQQVSLVALMWLGRGDYSIEEWPEALAFAEETWTDHTATYLIGVSLLADYLQEGVDQIDASH
jgi:hypothetical protein